MMVMRSGCEVVVFQITSGWRDYCGIAKEELVALMKRSRWWERRWKPRFCSTIIIEAFTPISVIALESS
jgi:hypothetical protein